MKVHSVSSFCRGRCWARGAYSLNKKRGGLGIGSPEKSIRSRKVKRFELPEKDLLGRSTGFTNF